MNKFQHFCLPMIISPKPSTHYPIPIIHYECLYPSSDVQREIFQKKRHYIDSLLDRAMTMVFIYSRSAKKKKHRLESDRQSWIRAIKESAIVLSTQPSSSILPSNDLLDKIDSALSEHLKNLNDHHISHTTISTMNNNGKNGDHYGVGDNNNTQSRTNTIIHVCWQRNCTITSADYRYALTVCWIFFCFVDVVVGVTTEFYSKHFFPIGFIQWIFIKKI